MKKIFLGLILAASFLLVGCETGALGGLGGGSNGGGSGNGCAHVDLNEDGVCDRCSESVSVTLEFLGLNDLHGKFEDTSAQEGVDELSTYITNAQADGNAIVLSSGDMWQGSPESNLTKGQLITEWMNEMDFASMTMGNHEYDWGLNYIKANEELAEFPLLGINIYDKATNKPVDYCQPSVMVERAGAKIGIIGAIGDCLSSISGEYNQDLIFKTGSQLTSLVKTEANRLRAEGADFIVYSVHGDYSEYDIALSNGYVDLVFEGHSHASYAKKDAKGIWHLQNGGDNGGVSRVEVTLNVASDKYTVDNAKFVPVSEYTHLADHPIVDTLMEKYDEQISLSGKVLGVNDKRRERYETLLTVASLYYKAGVEKWSEYDLVIGGGYMSMRAPGYIPAGRVTYGDLQNVLPFDNQLVLCSIRGSDLLERFLSIPDNYYIYSNESSLETLKSSIQASATYYLVTDTYSSTYAPNKLTEIERYDDKTFARDLLAKFIEEGGWTTSFEDLQTLTIPEALEIGNALPDGAATANKYKITGTILSIDPANSSGNQYGNMTIADDDGNEIYVYGTYDKAGNRYDKMENPPVVGDTVTLASVIKKYVNKQGAVKIELENATLLEIKTDGDDIGGNTGGDNTGENPADYETLTIEEAIALGNSKGHNEFTEEKYYITGIIANVPHATHGNLNLTDGKGNTIYIYGLYDEAGNKYESMTKKPVMGDTITVLTVVGKYNNPQLKDATVVELIEGETDWSKIEEITIEEALQKGEALADNAETGEYIVRGTIVSIEPQAEGKPHYGNMTITDGNGNELYVYGTYDLEGNRYGDMANPPKVGDTVALGGVIKKYVNSQGVAKIELMNGVILETQQAN